jgi:hypothetical protein
MEIAYTHGTTATHEQVAYLTGSFIARSFKLILLWSLGSFDLACRMPSCLPRSFPIKKLCKPYPSDSHTLN